MLWANFFHIYQPPRWPKTIIAQVVRESYRPLLHILKKHPRLKITLNICGSLTEQLAKHRFLDIISDIKKLVLKKQIELTGTALYHPMLPLLPEQEIIRQIELNTTVNKKYFDQLYQPKGFFPPEMGYSQKVAKITEKLGFEWLILDEISACGTLGKIGFNRAFVTPTTKSPVVFRNRIISDYLSFHSQLSNPSGFWQAVRRDGRSKKVLITAMDGENLGHHRPGLNRLWEKLVTHRGVETVTLSKLLEQYQQKQLVSPIPASWSSREKELKHNNPYSLWCDPQNPIHRWQWQLVNKVIRRINQHKKSRHYKQARALLDQQLASDQFWWASAKPWWSLDIIREKTLELKRAASLIDGAEEMKKTADTIITLARQWQRELTFQTIARDYLAAEARDSVRYIGGKKISVR